MAEETRIQGIEGGRAKFAWKCAKEAINKLDEKKRKDYKSYVKKIPMYIKTNGLGATLAFMCSKKDIYSYIGKQITAWLQEHPTKLIPLDGKADFETLLGKVVSLNSSTYRALTIEVLAFLNWLRRFAEGLIEDKEEGKGHETEI